MSDQLSAAAVLAALDAMLAPNTQHHATHLSTMRIRAKALRAQVAQYVDPASPEEGNN